MCPPAHCHGGTEMGFNSGGGVERGGRFGAMEEQALHRSGDGLRAWTLVQARGGGVGSTAHTCRHIACAWLLGCHVHYRSGGS